MIKKIRFKPPKNAREQVFQILYDVIEKHGFANLSYHLQQSFSLEIRDQNLVYAMVYGTLTHLVSIDHFISKRSKNPIEKLNPLLRTALRAAMWEIHYSYAAKSYALCNEWVEILKSYTHEGLTAYLNAILRAEIKEPQEISKKQVGLYYGIKNEIAGYFKKWFPNDYDAILTALNQEPPLTIRTNINQISPEDLKKLLEEEGVTVNPSVFMPQAFAIELNQKRLTQLDSFKKGLFFIQGEGAMLVSEIIPDMKEGTILDLCSAPGGKTTHILERFHDTVSVIARDIDELRLALVEENCQRLKLKNYRLECMDATEESDLKVDGVLVDVPCSGLGLLGRKPDIRIQMTHDRIQGLYPLQKSILNNAARQVKPGGWLLYSTCTLNPAENEAICFDFLDSEIGKAFDWLSFDESLPENLIQLDRSVIKQAKKGYLTLRPDIHHCEGFFMGLMLKKQSDESKNNE